MDIYTIGHSTHSIDEFIELLKEYNINLVVDVRSYPGSNYVPQFNKENMEKWLPEHSIQYIHLKDLGGRRNKNKDIDQALVEGWRQASFRNYAAYTFTKSYEEAIDKLLSLAKDKQLAYMCSEAVPWRCHRLIISNTLVARGVNVHHIINKNETISHELGKYGANPVLEDSKLIYPKESN